MWTQLRKRACMIEETFEAMKAVIFCGLYGVSFVMIFLLLITINDNFDDSLTRRLIVAFVMGCLWGERSLSYESK